jgi:alpha-glucosidase (family GH31 glycosyl hydrolase)
MAVFDAGTYASDYFVNTDFDGQGTSRITKVAVGGMIHKFFLQAPKIEEAIPKYQLLTGFQTVAQMWAFGWN